MERNNHSWQLGKKCGKLRSEDKEVLLLMILICSWSPQCPWSKAEGVVMGRGFRSDASKTTSCCCLQMVSVTTFAFWLHCSIENSVLGLRMFFCQKSSSRRQNHFIYMLKSSKSVIRIKIHSVVKFSSPVIWRACETTLRGPVLRFTENPSGRFLFQLRRRWVTAVINRKRHPQQTVAAVPMALAVAVTPNVKIPCHAQRMPQPQQRKEDNVFTPCVNSSVPRTRQIRICGSCL